MNYFPEGSGMAIDFCPGLRGGFLKTILMVRHGKILSSILYNIKNAG
jgi:hypothetical protein